MEALTQIDSEAGRSSAPQPIIIATDGTRQSAGALAVGRAVAVSLGTTAHVVAAQRSLRLIVPDARLLLDSDALSELTEDLRRRVREQCAMASNGAESAALLEPVVEDGEPDQVISRVAEDVGAQMVVVGLGRHDILDRIFGGETTLKIAQRSSAPVLAVPERSRLLPRSAAVAMDFSEPSIAAVGQTARLLPPGSVLNLVHVVPRERMLLDPWLSDREYERLVHHRFSRLRDSLSALPNVTLNEVIRTGDVARTLIGYADATNSELIAAGSHGHGFVARRLLGSVTTALLRAATSMVLIVPPRGVPHAQK